MATVKICDRCGKRIHERIENPDFKLEMVKLDMYISFDDVLHCLGNSRARERTFEELDLCRECYDSLVVWAQALQNPKGGD